MAIVGFGHSCRALLALSAAALYSFTANSAPFRAARPKSEQKHLVFVGRIVAVVSIIIWRYVRQVDRTSDLLVAEARQWGASAAFSALVALVPVATLAYVYLNETFIRPYSELTAVASHCTADARPPSAVISAMSRPGRAGWGSLAPVSASRPSHRAPR